MFESSDAESLLFLLSGCKVLFRQKLAKTWGKHCKSCEYCYSMSKKLVTATYGGSTEEFCSDDCRSKYTMLFCHVSKLHCSKISIFFWEIWLCPEWTFILCLRLRSATPVAKKGSSSRISPCLEMSNTSVTWRVYFSFAVIMWSHLKKSSIVKSFLLFDILVLWIYIFLILVKRSVHITF